MKKGKMKRVAQTGCLLLSAALLCAAAYVLNAFFGNPVSAYLAERSARAYLAERYGHLDVEIERFGYNFKTADYYAFVASDTSVDTHFSVYMRMNGEVRYDTYDSVTSGWNTWQRLEEEYRERTNALFDAPDFELRNDIAFGSLELKEESAYDYQPVPFGIELQALKLDGEYDVNELAKQAGKIVFYMQDEDVSFETAARGMLRLKEILDVEGIPFFAMDYVLRLPREEGKPGSGGPTIHVEDFLCSEIYEDGMAQRVRAAHEALKAFYEELDTK